MSHPVDTRVRFLKAWGHPTKNTIMGVGDTAMVSRRIADNLVSGGYAEIVTHDWQLTAHRAWEFCKTCGIVRRADDKNSPCKGPTRMREMEKAAQ